jgi:NAD-dependent SIR2 family protein deacetylase
VKKQLNISLKRRPQAFYSLAKELMPKNYKPTLSHYFQRIAVEKGHVLKIYTQNIDALENIAKIPSDKIINAHGSFNKGRCLSCKKEYSFEWMQSK